jgi:hypothetical protein
MIITLRLPFVIAVMLIALVNETTAQTQANAPSPVQVSRCRSICIYLETPQVGKSKPRFVSDEGGKVNAVLVNAMSWNIKVRAMGDDWLFYEAMSDIDTIKQRYSCHLCFVKTIRPKSSVRFKIFSEDLEGTYAIRLRFNYEWEQENSDELLHYVSWIRKE